jgi:hypothetical protein
VVEVHAVDGAYEGRGEEDGGPARDLLYLLVVLQTYEGQVDAQDVLQKVAVAGEALRDLLGVVLDVAQVAADLRVYVDGPAA